MVTTLTITKHDGSSKPKTNTVKVEDTATLKALRDIAQKQGIISPRDLFNDRAVHINVGGKDSSMKDGLRRSEKEFLFRKSRIGSGFDAADEEGPKYTNRKVVADLSVDGIAFTPSNKGQQDVVTAYSSRVSSYLQAGWVDASLAAKTPWVHLGVQASFSKSSARSESQTHVYITGRYNFAHYTLSMKDFISQLKPHPAFKQAVMNALKIANELERSQEIKRVLSFYGSMFVTSVEVGGMKHSTMETILDPKTTESSAKNQMGLTLGKMFGPASVGAKVGSGTENEQTRSQENGFESLHFHTITFTLRVTANLKGGNIEAPSFAEWRKSLSDRDEWGVTRVLEVQSALALFDKETQLKIALSTFATPLYHFTNKRGRHCLSTDPEPAKLPVGWDGHWVNDGPLGTVLTVPLDGAIPFHHVYNGKRHVFTNSQEEWNKLVSWRGFWDQGIACYVYNTHKPGTIPLSRTWNKKLGDCDYATSASKEDVEAGKKRGDTIDNSFRCYVYSK
ncbi:hypothetical protein FRC04_007558 [Tulasnella sp. 424]|nr:hypothetical protein FRC04_007558 [Tulasnella sp. 424]